MFPLIRIADGVIGTDRAGSARLIDEVERGGNEGIVTMQGSMNIGMVSRVRDDVKSVGDKEIVPMHLFCCVHRKMVARILFG